MVAGEPDLLEPLGLLRLLVLLVAPGDAIEGGAALVDGEGVARVADVGIEAPVVELHPQARDPDRLPPTVAVETERRLDVRDDVGGRSGGDADAGQPGEGGPERAAEEVIEHAADAGEKADGYDRQRYQEAAVGERGHGVEDADEIGNGVGLAGLVRSVLGAE